MNPSVSVPISFFSIPYPIFSGQDYHRPSRPARPLPEPRPTESSLPFSHPSPWAPALHSPQLLPTLLLSVHHCPCRQSSGASSSRLPAEPQVEGRPGSPCPCLSAYPLRPPGSQACKA